MFLGFPDSFDTVMKGLRAEHSARESVLVARIQNTELERRVSSDWYDIVNTGYMGLNLSYRIYPLWDCYVLSGLSS